MGKRIISQARGKGSMTYRVRRAAYVHRVGYPVKEGKGMITNLFKSAGHSAPLIKIKMDSGIFYNAAFDNAFQGQEIKIGIAEAKVGNILKIKNIPVGTRIYNIERNPGDGGKMIRTSGSSAIINKIYEFDKVGILMPHRKEIKLDGNCRATVGTIAGDGRKQKPFFKAGKMYHKMKSRGKLYPRISAVSMNAVDHPFGSGRGKRIKSKTAKRNAPPGRRVGHLRPSKTGKKR